MRDEATESIGNVSSSNRNFVDSSNTGLSYKKAGSHSGAKKVQLDKERVEGRSDGKQGLEAMADLSIDQDFKKIRATSSPKSAHHAMGLESLDLTDFD